LPYSRLSVQKIQALAAKIRTMGGEATLTETRFLDEKDHQRMVETFKAQSKNEFRELLIDMARLYEHLGGSGEVCDHKSIRKRYMKAKSRDYFDTESEMAASGFFGELFSELNMEGGWSELFSDLCQGSKDVGKILAGFLPELGNSHKVEEVEYDDSSI
ncbi:MAG: hypothetical protein RR461_02805, partial [Angelakisella sp.]